MMKQHPKQVRQAFNPCSTPSCGAQWMGCLAKHTVRMWALCWLLGLSLRVDAAPVDTSDELFTNASVRQIQIELTPEAKRTLANYHQVWGQKRPERQDVKATVREGDTVYTNVAMHLKGSFTFQPLDGKPSITLNFDKFAPGQRFHGLDKIHLNNSLQDATYLCEKLSRDLFREAGVPASRVGHAQVAVNGRALGFYILVEGYNKRFLKRHFNSVKGNLYDGGSGGDITKTLEVDSGETPQDRSDLDALIAAVRERGASKRASRMAEHLDVDRFLSFAAGEILLQHWDGYCMGPNNYRVFHDADQDKLVFLPHGLDQTLGVRRKTQSSITPPWGGMVARGLLGTAEGRRRYFTRLEQILNQHFKEEVIQAKIDRWAEGIRPFAAPGFIERFRFQSAINTLKTRVTERIQEVRSQLEAQEKPIAFGSENVLRLNGWTFKAPAASSMQGRRSEEQGLSILEVAASGGWSSGAWRRKLLLDTGHYELNGTVKVEGLTPNATNSGALLRISGVREATGMVMNTPWKPLKYDFEVEGPIEVELICEFRGATGSAAFDLSSLVLKKLPK